MEPDRLILNLCAVAVDAGRRGYAAVEAQALKDLGTLLPRRRGKPMKLATKAAPNAIPIKHQGMM